MLKYLALLALPLAAACATTPPAPPPFASDRISVETVGTGPDVILIPGLSSSPEGWGGTVVGVPGYRYHLVHVAGFAGKPPAANASGPVVEPVAEEIARYIREARLERPAIVGHSLGGFWAMMIAARHPELPSRIMVVDMLPSISVFAPPGTTPEQVREGAEQMRRAMAASEGARRRQAVAQTIASMVKTEELRPPLIEHTLASDPAVSGQAMYDLLVTDLRPELANVGVPITVLWVRAPTMPLTEEQMAEIYRASFANAPRAEVKHIPDSWHFIMLDAPERFRQELREFLVRE